MPSVLEQKVARSRNINYEERGLPQAVSDFYLLETLANIRGCPEAKAALERFERDLARQFAAYLDIAIGGELRYAKAMLGDGCPKQLRPFMREAHLPDRGTAWLAWTVVRRAWGMRALELAKEAFELPGWRGAFGGEAWASAVSVLSAYLEGRLSDRIFVDRCFSMEHNSGSILNKLWSTQDLPDVLDAHGEDDYAALLRFAGIEVKRLWRRQHWLERQDHDAVWLGVQQTDTYFDLWPEGESPVQPEAFVPAEK